MIFRIFTGEDVQTPIRATEGTVLSRIPPRVKIREHAPLELPHVMLLADDPQKTCIEAIGQHTARMRRVYDFDLMLDSGRLTGWRVNESDYGRIDALIERLSDETAFAERYGISLESGKKPLVLAVGDGNHSLATARQCWDNVKSNLSEAEQENHPARYALVELCNLHDDALDFEPIHRVVFGVEAPRLMRRMKEVCGLTEDASASGQKLSVVLDGQERAAVMTVLSHTLPVGTLQTFLDDYIRECGGEIDYIHGAEVVKALTRRPDAIGFLLSGITKSELYPTVVYDKTLPRKTFSMGEAWDKRFYCEARKLR